MYFEFMKNFLFVDSGEQMPVKLISASWAQKRVIPLSREYVREVHEKYSSRRFRLADACKTHFDLQSKKTFDSYFLEMMYVEFMKNFLSPISARRCLLDSFRPPEPENVWFLLSKHDVLRVHEKFSSRPFGRADAC